jgi:hypothetical protein
VFHKVPLPRYWQHVKHAACHWLINFNLGLAMSVPPKEPWRIHTSDAHSTLWNGDDVLFDMNASALRVDQWVLGFLARSLLNHRGDQYPLSILEV